MRFPVLRRESLTTQPSAQVAELLQRRAGIGPAEVDVVQLYHCFTITVLVTVPLVFLAVEEPHLLRDHPTIDRHW
jgi:thiolase-like protein